MDLFIQLGEINILLGVISHKFFILKLSFSCNLAVIEERLSPGSVEKGGDTMAGGSYPHYMDCLIDYYFFVVFIMLIYFVFVIFLIFLCECD